jgi:hypothetical protein
LSQSTIGTNCPQKPNDYHWNSAWQSPRRQDPISEDSFEKLQFPRREPIPAVR